MQNPPLELRLKPSANTHAITSDTAPETAFTRLGKEVKSPHLKLGDARTLHQAAYPQFDMSEFETYLPESWSDLRYDYGQYFKRIELPSEKLQIRLAHAGIAGSGAIGAFLEVITEVVPNNHIRYAQRSRKTIMDWAGLTESADGSLTYAVVLNEPNFNLSNEEMYRNLQFDPQYFTHNAQRVVLNLDALKARELQTNIKIDRRAKGSDVYFGCPMKKAIPKLYSSMLSAAMRGELLR